MRVIRRVALGVIVALVASALPTAVVNVAVAPAAHATANPLPAHPGGPFPINLGDQVDTDPATGRGIVEGPGDEDVYTFTVGAGGQRAYPQWLADRRVSGYMRWNLRDSDGRVIFDNGDNPEILYLRADTYTLTVAASKGYFRGSHPYSFKLWAVPDQQDFSLTVAAKGQGVIVQKDSPAQNAGNLESIGSQDVYTFTAPSNGLVLERRGGWPQCGYCTVTVRDAAGQVLASNGLDTFRLPHLTAGATYKLSVQQHNVGDLGEYKFELWTMPDVNLSSNVTLGTAKSGNLATFVSQDAYTYQLTASSKISIQTSVASCRAQYTLFAPNGANLYSFCSAGTTVLTVPVTGLYRVLVTPNPGATLPLPYTLTVASSTATPTVTLNQELFSINPAAAKASLAIGNGVPAAGAGNIESSTAQDLYAISVTTPGQRLYFQYDSAATPAWVFNWKLRGPDGTLMPLESGGLFDATMISDRKIVSFPDAGIYTLTVSGVGAPYMGTYGLKIWTVATPDQAGLTLAPSKNKVAIPSNATVKAPATAGNLDGIGSRDIYTFHVNNAGQRVFFKYISASQTTMDWKLTGPDGGTIFEAYLHDMGNVTFTQAGDYFLSVYDSGAGTGTYSIELWGVELPKVFPISVGDTVENGKLNGVASPEASGMGNLESFGATDVYTFHADAGELVYIDSISHSGERWDVRMVNGFAMPSEDSQYFSVGKGSGRYRMRRSGNYSIVVTKDATVTYKFKLVHVDEPDQFPNVTLPFSVPNSSLGARAGNLETQGARDAYTFTGTAGQQIALNQDDAWLTHGGWRWELVDEHGLSLMPNPAADGSQPYQTVSSITLPRDGKYTLTVWDDASCLFQEPPLCTNSAGGTYTFDVAVLGTTPVTTPAADPPFVMNIGDPIGLNAPQPGAGQLEAAGAVDVYQFDATSGDAIVLDASGPNCPGNSARWNLRAPDGSVYLDRRMSECEVGPIVLPLQGTWLLSVGGSSGRVQYDIALTRAASLQELPRAGQGSNPPAVTRIDPPKGNAGGTSTFNIYGSNLPKITAVHIGRPGAPELPTIVKSSNAVQTDLEARAAIAQVDLRAVTALGNYPLRVSTANGSSLAYRLPFVVTAGAEPSVDISLNYRPLAPATLNYAFVDIRNRSAADYYGLPLSIRVPCDKATTTWNGHPYTASVKLRLPDQDNSWIISSLQARGADAATIDAVASHPLSNIVSSVKDANGDCRIETYVTVVPSGGTTSLRLEIIPITPPDIHAGGQLGPIAIDVYNSGTHASPEAPDFVFRKIVRASATGSSALSRSTFARAAFSGPPCNGPFCNPGVPSPNDLPWPFNPNAPHGEVPESVADGGKEFGCEALGHFLGIAEIIGGPATAFLCLCLTPATAHAPTSPQDCDPNPPEDPPIAPGADPNDILGPIRVAAGDWVDYTIDFENIGVGAIQAADVTADLDPAKVDVGSLEWRSVRVGDQELPLLGTKESSHTALEVNGNVVRANALLNGNSLRVELRGDDDGYHGEFGDFLPPNTEANDPAGKGEVMFRVRARRDLTPGTDISQAATVVFQPQSIGGGTSLTTNTWHTTIDLLPGEARSAKARSSRLTPGMTTVFWKAPRSTVTRPAGTVEAYVIHWERWAIGSDGRWAKVADTDHAKTVSIADVTQVRTKLSYVINDVWAGSPPPSSGTTYWRFSVTARNAIGSGPASKLSSKRPVY
jgi:hypothetical protein